MATVRSTAAVRIAHIQNWRCTTILSSQRASPSLSQSLRQISSRNSSRLSNSANRWYSTNYSSVLRKVQGTAITSARRFQSSTTFSAAPASRRFLPRRILLKTFLTTLALGTGYVTYSIATHEPLVLPSNPDDPIFNNIDPRLPFKDKSTFEVFRSYVVLKVCTWTTLVDITPRLLALSKLLHLDSIVNTVVKHSFFDHFCGGEDVSELAPTMAEFKKAGIGSILDISIESDLQERSIKPGSADDTENVRKLANQKAEEAKDLIRKCVEAASLEPNSYAAIKVTALGPTVVLKKISSSLRTVIQKFKEVDVDCDGKITISEFKSLVSALPGAKSVDDKTVTSLFNSYSKKSSMDFISLMQLFSFDNPASVSLLCHPNDNTLSASDTTTLTHTDVSEFKILISRMDEVCELARNKKVKLMIDAEQTYFQDAIDYVALEMSKRYNKIEKKSKNVKPMIYNTYQLYLKEGNSKMVNDYSRAEREGWAFAAKLVRGAYMISERKRASTLSYPSPINDTLADTHASYNSALSFLISRLPSNPTTSICVASHNKDSIILTAKLMSANGIKNDDERIVFGQLKGMYDLLSYGLASKGYRGYKYIPYGPVEEVIPYLLRRAQENSAILGGAQLERELLRNELLSRCREYLSLPLLSSSEVGEPKVVVNVAHCSKEE